MNILDQFQINFAFKRGAFQGNSWPPILFRMVFYSIVQYIKPHEENSGYSLNGYKYMPLPFADDFYLITANKINSPKTHQRHQREASAQTIEV